MKSVGRPLAFESVEQLATAIDSYFETSAYIDIGDARMYAPTMSGLAEALGVDRKTITNYSHKEEYFPTIKSARAKVEIALEQRLYGNNVAGVIFNLKNNFGWADKQEIDHGLQKNNPIADLLAQVSGKTIEPNE